jgi:uncharacterized protein (TIGR02246 family)
MSTQKSSTSRSSTVIERTYRTRVEELWGLWTTKEGFESWWGSEGSRVEVHTIEAREGGALHYHMIAVAPADVAARKQMGLPPGSAVRARFAEFRPYQRLILAHVIDFVPGLQAYEQLIAVDFFPAGDTVRMVTTIEPMHNEEFTQTSVRVFTGQLEMLERRFRMASDERAIREVHTTWIDAVNAGDLDRLLALMADDVVFLNPGQAPCGRDGFPVGFSAAHQQSRICCSSELEDVVIVGEVAYTRCRDSLSVTPRAGGESTELAGHRIAIYRKQPDGRWLVARDANTLSRVAS